MNIHQTFSFHINGKQVASIEKYRGRWLFIGLLPNTTDWKIITDDFSLDHLHLKVLEWIEKEYS